MADTTGQVNLRKEHIEATVTGFALQSYKMKELCMINTSDAWIESYYKETKNELTATGAGANVKGIPRLAAFPYGEVSWEKVSSYIEKYGLEGTISWEDEHKNNIDVISRTLLRIGRAVAYAIDLQIESAISTAAGINTLALTAGYEWNSATIANRDPIKDILDAIQTIRTDNYDPLNGSGYLVVNGTSYTDLISNSKVINNPTFKSADVVTNGNVGQICGLTIKVTEVVTTDQGYVVIAKEALTWQQAAPLTTVVIEDPGIKKTIRAWEVGVCQCPNPEAICKITNLRA